LSNYSRESSTKKNEECGVKQMRTSDRRSEGKRLVVEIGALFLLMRGRE